MFFDAGSGPALVVVPGVQGRWEWIRPALEELKNHCRTISYSLCGDFRSECRLDPSKGFDNYLDQLDAVLDRAGVEQAAVCGISYGGCIALRYAATRRARVFGLVISSSPAPGWEPTALQSAYIASPWRATPRFVATSPVRLWPEIRAAFDSPLARLGFLARHGLRAAVAPMYPALMASRIVEQQRIDFAPDCAQVTSPTLIVTGDNGLDKIVPVESTMRFLDMIPGARHARIPKTGHLGLVTKPKEFASVVGNFVRDAGAGSRQPEAGR